VTVVPAGNGFRVSCNRDERRDRPPALPPAIHALAHRKAIYPVDPLGPGTWVGVNDAGLAAAVLNRAGDPIDARVPSMRPSRGLVIPALLECVSLGQALEVCEGLNLSRFAPFCLLIVHKLDVVVRTADGCMITRSHLCRPLMHTSSALGDELVERARGQLFERLFGGEPSSWLTAQIHFHRHQWRSRRELSVLMERADAKTVSHTVIDVSARGIELRYREVGSRQTFLVRAV
jgi:hypothetical protein